MRHTSTPQRPPLHRLLPLALLGGMLASPVSAQDPGAYYVGLGVGQTRGGLDALRIGDGVVAPVAGGFSSQTVTTDNRDVGYKVFGGYQMTPWLGMELGYFHLGKQRFTTTTVPAGQLNGQLRSQGVNLDLVGTVPVSGNLSALLRAGVAYARTRDQFSGSGAVVVTNPTPSDRSANLKLGVGLQYAFSPSVLLRGEAERYRNSDAVGGHGHVNLFSVSLVFPFGGAPATMRRTAAPMPMPMPMAAAPMPPPAPMPAAMPAPAPVVAVVVPPPAVPRRISLSTESLFGFDAAQVQPAGQTALDSFSAELAGASYSSIQIEGHTDRLGSSAYNQALSLQRAEAVKAYLVTHGKLDPAKLQAVGKGETMPVTDAATCPGQRQSSALIACLQPDRRVVIDVAGSR
ncbi:OmpA family protein [Pseudaquabacterium pictum]|uniref:Porin OmpA n=1 Tax=Pseudaquabacterium pictum TaxID=2315236 RepID=A0A480AM37_9BURK|nr:OmpA family protein [Rubrivivax pictus]GCL61810.1 porin OmpA [Rubrivivax pictus]